MVTIEAKVKFECEDGSTHFKNFSAREETMAEALALIQEYIEDVEDQNCWVATDVHVKSM